MVTDSKTTHNQDDMITSDVQLALPTAMWDAFDAWRADHGCKTRAEGFRCIMQEVTTLEANS